MDNQTFKLVLMEDERKYEHEKSVSTNQLADLMVDEQFNHVQFKKDNVSGSMII